MVAGQKNHFTSGEGLGQLLHHGSLPRGRQLWLYLHRAVEEEEEALVHSLRTKITHGTKTVHGRRPLPSTKVSLSARSSNNP